MYRLSEYCIVISWCQQNVLSTNKYPARDFNSDDKRYKQIL